MKTEIIIVRHGNTFLPDEPARRVGGRTDLPLVPSGRQQAIDLGIYFQKHSIHLAKIFTGPLLRTQQTAALIKETAQLQTDIHIENDLKEIDYGIDENQPESIVQARIGKEALLAWEQSAQVPQGWSVNPIKLENFWLNFGNKILNEYTGKCVMVVTSNGVARFVYSLLGGHPFLIQNNGLKLSTGSFGHLENESHNNWKLINWNIKPTSKK